MRPELIEAVGLLRSNDAASVNEAIALLQKTVYAFSMKVCGRPEDAEDTMQDVLIRALPHLAKISDPRALAVWLYTVTKNRCWRTRRKAVHAPKQILSLEELMPDEKELGLLLKDPGANPEHLILLAEQNQMLHEAILSVPPEYRIVLVLHDIEDLDTEQVAQVLGLLPGTVRVRLHRARLYVRKAIFVEKTSLKQSSSQRRPRKGHKGTAVPQRTQQCREIFKNLSEYLDDRMNPDSSEEMCRHIEACPACIVFIDEMRRAIDRCRKLDVACDPQIAPILRSLLTKEYLRMINLSLIK